MKRLLALLFFDWHTLFQQAVARMYVTHAIGKDFQEEGRMLYGKYSVSTEPKPCWVGMTADTLLPIWCLSGHSTVIMRD